MVLWLFWQLGHLACRKDVAPTSALLLSDLGSASTCDLLSLRLRCIVLSFRSIGCARSRSAQEINKHISDGVRAENKLKTAKTKEAKEFSKSKAEMERDGQEPYILA